MRVAYADPPYIGCAHLYRDRPDYGGEVDHAALIERLCTFEAWVLSLHSPSLKIVLPMCPEDVRVMAWVKPFAIFKPNVNPAYCWEPVIVRGGRKRGRDEITVRDWISAPAKLGGFKGAKPERFCLWMFDVLGLVPTDEFHDLFPGSGAVGRAWKQFQKQQRLPLAVGTEDDCWAQTPLPYLT